MDVAVTLGDLFAHPTLESLSARVQGAAHPDRNDRAIPVRAAGSQRPLFLVHEGTGSISYAQVLHPYVDADIPVYVLPAASAPEFSPGTLEGMATRMVAMIREVQPAGPYRLAGWSFGGVLAYEIAAQLIAQGQTVEFVGMMDSYHPAVVGAGGDDAGYDQAVLLRMLRMDQGMSVAAGPALVELATAAATMDLEALVARCHETGLLPRHVAAAQVRQMRDRMLANHRALREYVPRPLPIPVHLFPARQSPGRDPRRGWQTLLDETALQVTPVPGTHLSMMKADNVRSLGEALSREISLATHRRKVHPGDGHPLV
jgi:thioesterase domain-containing protein